MTGPLIVTTEELPPAGGDVDRRPLGGHPGLRGLLPDAASSVRLSWLRLTAGQKLEEPRPTAGALLVVLSGSAQLSATGTSEIVEGDSVTLPAEQRYAIECGATEGLTALHVVFGAGASHPPEGEADESAKLGSQRASLSELLAHNQRRAQQMLDAPFFSLLRDRGLDSEAKRCATTDCLRVFADAFQMLLFSRQAACRDERFSELFGEHLREELGHNSLLRTPSTVVQTDPVLRATSTWFCHQMLVLDNVDKIVVNLVLETAGYHLGTLAGPLFEGHEAESFFHTHGEADAGHMNLGVELLDGQPEQTYRRLIALADKSWDMLGAMTERIVAHVGNAGA